MPVIAAVTLAQAQAQLDAYLAAEQAVLKNQRYQIGDRHWQRADLAEIRQGIQTWSETVQALSQRRSGRRRSFAPIPRF